MKIPDNKTELLEFLKPEKNSIEKCYSVFPIVLEFQEQFESVEIIAKDFEGLVEFIESQNGYSVPLYSISEDATGGEVFVHHNDLLGHNEFIDKLVPRLYASSVFKNGAISSSYDMPDGKKTEYLFLNPERRFNNDADDSEFPFEDEGYFEMLEKNKFEKGRKIFLVLFLSIITIFLFYMTLS